VNKSGVRKASESDCVSHRMRWLREVGNKEWMPTLSLANLGVWGPSWPIPDLVHCRCYITGFSGHITSGNKMGSGATSYKLEDQSHHGSRTPGSNAVIHFTSGWCCFAASDIVPYWACVS